MLETKYADGRLDMLVTDLRYRRPIQFGQPASALWLTPFMILQLLEPLCNFNMVSYMATAAKLLDWNAHGLKLTSLQCLKGNCGARYQKNYVKQLLTFYILYKL